MADVAAEAVGVEVMVAAGLGERLSLLKTNRRPRVSAQIEPRAAHVQNHAHLKPIETNDTVSVWNVAFGQDFFCFLHKKNQDHYVGKHTHVSSISKYKYNDLNKLIQHWGTQTGLSLQLKTPVDTKRK